MSWYRTYRPQTVSTLGCAPVRLAFEQILESGSFSHAYILSGPKGTGKTSGARILAKIVNCEKNAGVIAEHIATVPQSKTNKRKLLEPCNECGLCKRITSGQSLCVTEMDAASNRGIDDIRLLTSSVGLGIGEGLIHVYIIDEVHMLTVEAFNALLKVLEEPPTHVMFILATTELHKVPQTILSRCTPIVYRKGTLEEIVGTLQAIAAREGITFDPGCIENVAGYADGSFRDAVKIFEQVSGNKKHITSVDIESNLGKGISQKVEALLQSLAIRSYDLVLTLFKDCEQEGIDLVVLQKEVLRSLNARLLSGTESDSPHVLTYIQLLKALNIPPSALLPIPGLPFELVCLEWCVVKNDKGKQENTNLNPSETKIKEKKHVDDAVTDSKPPEKKEEATPAEISIEIHEITNRWHEVLSQVRKKNSTVEALLRAARPDSIHASTLQIEVVYAFHKEQLEADRNRRVLEEALASLFETKLKTAFVLNTKGKTNQKTSESTISSGADDAGLVKAAQDAFL